MKVFVYFNLRRKLFSIKALEGESKGKVIGHSRQIVLENVTYKVSEAGRQRVIREKRKNVHAGVVGEVTHLLAPLLSASVEWGECKERVRYNPYKHSNFITEDNQPVLQGKFAEMRVINHKPELWNFK